jgi:2-phosphosulfolactate phosphatase
VTAVDRSVAIDCFHAGDAIEATATLVAIDVIRATTTIVTAVSRGRRCFPVASLEEADLVAEGLVDPLLGGEVAGRRPEHFEMNNSPTELTRRTDTRPLVLLSSSGTRLVAASRAELTYVACLRNRAATVRNLLATDARQILVVGAGSRGTFRAEDRVCAAWIARELVVAGYQPRNPATIELIDRWAGAGLEAIAAGESATYLRRTGQIEDLDFVLAHVDDVDTAFLVSNGEVVPATVGSLADA